MLMAFPTPSSHAISITSPTYLMQQDMAGSLGVLTLGLSQNELEDLIEKQ